MEKILLNHIPKDIIEYILVPMMRPKEEYDRVMKEMMMKFRKPQLRKPPDDIRLILPFLILHTTDVPSETDMSGMRPELWRILHYIQPHHSPTCYEFSGFQNHIYFKQISYGKLMSQVRKLPVRYETVASRKHRHKKYEEFISDVESISSLYEKRTRFQRFFQGCFCVFKHGGF